MHSSNMFANPIKDTNTVWFVNLDVTHSICLITVGTLWLNESHAPTFGPKV